MEGAHTIPAHLRDLVVTQDYPQYTEQDHSVWRFVVKHTARRLQRTAHAGYAKGFEAAGITIDCIPRIADISAQLSSFGWSAVCVDGFIPPRAFQAFQAQRILPIAADIRTRQHLTYTPAPDIVHEAAGHAPFLSEPRYANYLTRIGLVGSRAFSTAADRAIYDAIYTLSEMKENPASTPVQLASAQRAFEAAMAVQGPPSEAAQLARLYWWTVEYGLSGSPSSYRLYGAGLLSSIGEGYFCDDPNVAKLPLTAACIDVGYDITRPQPQLFVAEDFEHLSTVLDTVAGAMSQSKGGLLGLQRARDSEELATLTLDTGAQLSGYVHAVQAQPDAHEHASLIVQLDGPCAIALPEIGSAMTPKVDTGLDGVDLSKGYTAVLGWLDDGTPFGRMTENAFLRHMRADQYIALTLSGGISVVGKVERRVARNGRILLALLSHLRVMRGDVELVHSPNAYPWLLGSAVTAVSAGGFGGHEITSRHPSVRVPKPRVLNAPEAEMLVLYQQTFAAFRAHTSDALVDAIEPIAQRLDAAYPEEWLLRYELLFGLIRAMQAPRLQAQLSAQLEALEIRYAHREPIATGLAYLRERAHPEHP